MGAEKALDLNYVIEASIKEVLHFPLFSYSVPEPKYTLITSKQANPFFEIFFVSGLGGI